MVDNSNPTVQALAEGQTLVDNAFTYTVTDGTTTTTAPLTITVFGTNDAPVASADTNWAKEDTSGAIGNVLQSLAHKERHPVEPPITPIPMSTMGRR